MLGSPDEEEKEDNISEISNEGLDETKTQVEEPLTNERFYLDNGEGTCEIKELLFYDCYNDK